MDLKYLRELLEFLKKILLVTDAIELDIDLGLTKGFVLMGLLKKIAISQEKTTGDLIKEFKASPKDFFSGIGVLMFEEFDHEKEEYGLLSKEILKVISSILKLPDDKPIQEMNILEFIEVVEQVGLKFEAKLGSGFLTTRGTTPAPNPEKSSITEIASKAKKKKGKKA